MTIRVTATVSAKDKAEMKAERRVGTYFFFDLESTGLPGPSARVTELSMVAVTTDDLEHLHRGVAKYNINASL